MLGVTSSGLPDVGELSWGTHICALYGSRQDLVDTLIPYFAAGLARREACLWVTGEPFAAADARAALAAAVPGLDSWVGQGQLCIVDEAAWRASGAGRTPAAGLDRWIQHADAARRDGYSGLRIGGNIAGHEGTAGQAGHSPPCDHRTSLTLASEPIVALCTFSVDGCSNHQILDVVRNHQFALVRRNGVREQIERTTSASSRLELERQAAELERRVQERTSALRARDEFLSVASHELRTPLASLKLYLDTLIRGLDGGRLDLAATADRLRKAGRQCERLQGLLDNLLDVSRLRSGKLDLVAEDVDLREIVDSTRERFAAQLARSGMTFRAESAPGIVGHWDRLRLEQVMTNLLANTVRHAPGAAVRVEGKRQGDAAVIEVHDTGPGIPPTQREAIFERFRQGGSAREGLGIGLWISREIVRALGGTIAVGGAPGAGTTFTVTLPLGGSAGV
jgi:signal transduction histidine kinase